MYRYRTFAKFPLLTKQKIEVKSKKVADQQKKTKIPSKIVQPFLGYKTLEFKGYKFFVPKLFVRKKGKESEYINVEQRETILL